MARNPFQIAADLLDPPAWQPPEHIELHAHQIPPTVPFRTWICEGGRGSGKSFGIARYFAIKMRERPRRGLIVAPTFDDAVESCVNGPSGLKHHDPEVVMKTRPGGTFVIWPNGSEAKLLGTHSPADVERFRAAGNRTIVWWEEMAASRYLQEAWDQMRFGLRGASDTQIVVSTTPRNRAAYKKIRERAGTIVTHAATSVNRANLNPEVVAEWEAEYGGTTLGRQELGGELIDDVAGALVARRLIDDNRVTSVPDGYWTRIVVGVDPAATSGEQADSTGIIVAALGLDGHVYVLDDCTIRATPGVWAQQVVDAYHHWEANLVVAEVNQGGEMVTHVLATTDVTVPVKAVHASRGKRTRAEPVAALYERGMVHHLGAFPELEDELTSWVAGSKQRSPDRVDALVWACALLDPHAQVPTVPIGQPDRYARPDTNNGFSSGLLNRNW